jgi:CubicO group peptidase (beta-lactamase class C family)
MVAAYVPEADSIRKLNIGQTFADSGVSSDYHLESNKGLSGGGGLSSTAEDYMRFCQMLLNGGIFNGTRVLKEKTVKLMTKDQTIGLPNNFGFGFTIFQDEEEVHQQLRGAYAWFGFWTTSFRVSPRGDWIIVTMSQVAWDEEVTPARLAEYEKIAAESVID